MKNGAIKVNVKELLQLIKNEELYKYEAFEIGSPHAKDNIGTFIGGAESIGICQVSDGIWREYRVSDRGGVTYVSGELANPKDFTENEACHWLLYGLRLRKDIIIQDHRKRHYVIRNADKWLNI